MPIIKQAKKRAKQNITRRDRNYGVRNALRKAIRAVVDAVKGGSKTEAEASLKNAYKVIDTATKKKVLVKNTASRRKSKLAKMTAGISEDKAPKAVEAKAPAKKPAVKKAAPKKKA